MRTGNVIENKNTRIEFSKWTELQKLASRIQARRPPVEVKESRGLADSDVIVIEIAQQGSYNILVRSGLSAKEDIILMAGSVIRQASGEYYKLWTRVREAQEKCRDPNLSETEDLGDH